MDFDGQRKLSEILVSLLVRWQDQGELGIKSMERYADYLLGYGHIGEGGVVWSLPRGNHCLRSYGQLGWRRCGVLARMDQVDSLTHAEGRHWKDREDKNLCNLCHEGIYYSDYGDSCHDFQYSARQVEGARGRNNFMAVNRHQPCGDLRKNDGLGFCFSLGTYSFFGIDFCSV
jgi:hypothetical protein